MTTRNELKAKCDELGIAYKNNTPTATLDQWIKEKEAGKPLSDEETPIQKATRLIRCQIVNNNPNKQNHEGELITVCFSFMPKISRFVPFNKEATHIENAIYKYLLTKKYNLPVIDDKGNIKLRELNEYTITKLPPLTEAELKALAKAQSVRNNEEEGK